MAAGGTFRTLAIANVLAETGFDVTVLTATRDAFPGFTGLDDALVERIDPRITVERIPFEGPAAKWDIRRWSKQRSESPAEWSRRQERLADEGFPERRFGAWHEPLVAAAERVHRRRAVDVVVGSTNPHVVMSAGFHLHERFGVPYVIDHRDAWRLNCYLGTEMWKDNPLVAELESGYMANAHQIWFVNDAIRRWHQDLYPFARDRMRVVENGFDEEFAPTPRYEPPPRDRPLTFSYVGSLSSRVPVEEFVEGWIDARRRSPLLADATAHLHGPSHGGLPRRHLLAAAEKYGVFHHGPLSKSDVASVYERADVLLLLLAGGRYVTSGKVYEYLSAALPIVSVHDPENGATEVLADYPLWTPNEDLTPERIGDALIAAAEGAYEADHAAREACHEVALRSERHVRLRPPIRELYEWVVSRQEVTS